MTKIKVWIDAGHGMPDPGASTGGYQEASNVLKIAQNILLLERYLPDVAFNYSRLQDTRLVKTDAREDLLERVRRATVWGADFFISIHQNANDARTGRGIETFHIPNSTSNAPQLAKCIQEKLVEDLNLTDRKVKQSNFTVLVGCERAGIPAVLTEVGFIGGHPDEARIVSDENFLGTAAAAIMQGLAKFLGMPYAPKPVWDKQGELDKLLASGVINTPRQVGQPVTWDELATILNRYDLSKIRR